MSFCRRREEPSSEKNIVRNTFICYSVIVILVTLVENFYVTFFCKNQNSLVTSEANHCLIDIFRWFDRVRQGLQECEYQKEF
jgi:hypothetical protein